MRPIHSVPTGRGLRPLFTWLTRRGPTWLRIAAGFFLLLCFVTIFLWWGDVSHSRTISLKTLTEEFEETKQSRKGLEAFVLSGLGDEIGERLKDITVKREFVQAFNRLQKDVESAEPVALPELMMYPLGKAVITEKFVTNKIGEDFLFIPGMVVGAWVPANDRDEDILDKVNNVSHEFTTKDNVRVVEKCDGVLKDNIAASEKAARGLKELLNVEALSGGQDVISASPVQDYFMSSTGLIRLNGNMKDAHGDSLEKFTPTSFFPDRPYFWNTIEKGPEGLISPEDREYKINDIFIRTNPYIDLGGNGIVITLSRKLRGVNVASGLFIDFGLGPEAENLIRRKIEGLGGLVRKTTWHVDGDVSRGEHLPSLPDGQEELLKDEIRKHKGNLAEIFGKLFVLTKQERKVAFTIPVKADDKSKQTYGALLYCELDLDRFQWQLSLKAAAIAGSFAGLVCCVLLLADDYRKRLREQEKAFESFGRVMAQAPVAYCRLDEHDKFIELNREFAALLCYESLEAARESLVNRQTFESLLADDKSRRKYGYIRDKRMNRKLTDPYHVRLRCEGGEKEVVDVRVYGASVPKPESHPKAIPETFGIVLEEGVKVMSSREMTVTPVLGLPKELPNPADLFVLMDFAPEFGPVYKSIERVAEGLSLEVTRGDQSRSAQIVISEVWAAIYAARVLIADCTGGNPNVLYEIGIAHVLGRPVILITQNEKDIPFNLRNWRFIEYDKDTWVGMTQFERKLEETIQSELRPRAK